MSEEEEQVVAQGPSVVELDVKELENACKHLERSNIELQAYLQENGEDKDIRDAILENEQALVTKRKRIEDLKNVLAGGGSQFLDVNESREKQAVPLTHQADLIERAARSGNPVAQMLLQGGADRTHAMNPVAQTLAESSTTSETKASSDTVDTLAQQNATAKDKSNEEEEDPGILL